MPKLSIIISCDTRPQRDSFGGENLTGVVNEDFLTDGIYNKVKFFDGFDKEVIVSIDEHLPVPENTLRYIRTLADVVLIRKHTNEDGFNDNNYLRSLHLASGDIIVKIDQDTALFAKDKFVVSDLLGTLDDCDFISYPSHWSPHPVIDNSFDHRWCSTRFFMCKKESLDLAEIEKCKDYEYWCNTYPVNRKCPWLEHWIGSIAKYRNQEIYYPKMDTSNYIIFSWGSYEKYTLRRLNEMPYSEIEKWLSTHPINYPCDIFC